MRLLLYRGQEQYVKMYTFKFCCILLYSYRLVQVYRLLEYILLLFGCLRGMKYSTLIS